MANQAVVYLRVSTKKQEDGGTSLETQEAECRAYCAAQGLSIAAVVRDSCSGATMDRPGLQRALDCIRQQEADTLVVYAYDRLSRNQNHQTILVYEVEEQRGGRVLSVTEERDDSPVGALVRSMRGWMAAEERKKIIERTQRGMRQRARNGKLLVSVPLYGYALNTERTGYVLDPATAPIVARIFQMAIAGRTMTAIATALSHEGVPTPSQRHAAGGTNGMRKVATVWNGETIGRLIHTPTYKGEPVAYRHHFHKARRKDSETGLMQPINRRVPGTDLIPLPADGTTAPAIVSATDWQAANDALERTRQELPRANKHPENYLLRAGFVFCAHCGRPMYTRSNGRGDIRYRCGTKFGSRRAGNYCPGGAPSVKCNTLDADIWTKVVILLNTDAIAQTLLARSEGSQAEGGETDALRSRLAGYDGTIADLQRRRSTIRRQQEQAADDDEFDELAARAEDVSQRLHSLQAERAELAERIAGLVATQDKVKPILGRLLLNRAQESRQLAADYPSPPPESGYEALPGIGETYDEQATRIQGQAIEVIADSLSMREKRALLRWLGVRVEVSRHDALQPDGTHWQLVLETPLGNG